MTDWAGIVDEYGPLVWGIALRLLGNEADSSDCFQETFTSALRLERRQPILQWKAALAQLATARALDQLRRRYRDVGRRNGSAHLPDVVSTMPGPCEQAQSAELAERLREALAELPARDAEVFCLRQLDELSYREIAERLDLEVNAVGVYLHRARSRLRTLLDQWTASPKT